MAGHSDDRLVTVIQNPIALPQLHGHEALLRADITCRAFYAVWLLKQTVCGAIPARFSINGAADD